MCGCLSSSPQPECKEADCEQLGLLWLTHPEFVVEGYIFLSSTRGTFSSAGISRSTWSVDGGSLQLDTRAFQPWKCDADRLVLGNEEWRRGPRGMSKGLDRTYDGGSWISATVDGGA
jgi:hypothetical protein